MFVTDIDIGWGLLASRIACCVEDMSLNGILVRNRVGDDVPQGSHRPPLHRPEGQWRSGHKLQLRSHMRSTTRPFLGSVFWFLGPGRTRGAQNAPTPKPRYMYYPKCSTRFPGAQGPETCGDRHSGPEFLPTRNGPTAHLSRGSVRAGSLLVVAGLRASTKHHARDHLIL
jgi:hypothetical protein